MLLVLCMMTVLCGITFGAETLLIGAIFPGEAQQSMELALTLAVDRINSDPSVLPNHRIAFISNVTGTLSTFENIQKVCDQLLHGVTAIIGPLSSSSVKASYPMCHGFHVPMIAPAATDPTLGNRDFYEYLLRMTSSDAVQSEALVDFISYFRWDTLAILTDNTDYGINGVIQLQTEASERLWRILSVQQFSVSSNISATNAIEQLNVIKGTGAHVVILNCLAAHGVYVLEQAHQLGMLQSGWAWIVTDGITSYEDLPDLVETRPYLKGVVGIRSARQTGAMYDEFNQTMYDESNGTHFESWVMAYYDAVSVYAQALHHLIEEDAYIIRTESHNCRQVPARVWRQGSVVYKSLTQVKTEGVMRDLEFTPEGGPINSAYEFVSLNEHGWIQHGQWSQDAGLRLNISGIRSFGGRELHDVRDYVGDLLNKTLSVVTVVDPPFVFKLDPGDERDDVVCGPDDCYYGYAIDLLQHLSGTLQFNFVIREAVDKTYGRKDEMTSKWNGLISMLIEDEDGLVDADFGVGAITISSERQSVIAFTKPYRDLQMGILLGSGEETFNPWSFLTPLSYELWGFTIGTAFVVGILITCVDKISPFGHHGTKAQIDGEFEHEAMDTNDDGTVDYWEMKDWHSEKQTMSLHNAILWSLASLFQQGGERHPKSWSARVAAGAWWFGVLIITSSYTANLAAFLTIKDSSDEISSVEDLAAQSTITYGTVKDTHIHEFFDTAVRDPYIRMAGNMREWDSSFSSTEDAVQHTIDANGSFAFLYDMPAVTYWKGQNCRLTMAKNGFANVGYGFALPLGSLYAEELTIKIYALRESGYMDSLDNKWLVKTAVCSDAEPDLGSETVTIDMPSLWGVFWIIYVGFGISLALAIIEWFLSALIAVNQNDDKAPQSFKESLRRRFRILRKDILENWCINFHRKQIKRHEQAMRPVSTAIRAAVRLKMQLKAVRKRNNKDSIGKEIQGQTASVGDDSMLSPVGQSERDTTSILSNGNIRQDA